MRVLTLSSLFPDATRPNFGVFVERQAQGLAAREGVTVTVIAPVGLPPPPFSLHPHYRALARLPERQTWRGLDVHRPRFTVLPGTGGRLHVAALARALRRATRDLDFDVIDASFFFPDGPAAVMLAQARGVPVSIKARGADIHHWGRAPGPAAQIVRAGAAADGLLAVSAAMADDMVALGLPRPMVHHTGVDLARFVPMPRAAGKAMLGVAGPLVVSVGALIPRKRHDVVIDAVAALPGVHLRIAGEGPERAALAARIARSGAADRIRLLGAVAHADLPAIVAAGDVMALASESEGLANAWVEALACGTPIVIAEAGGAREVVTGPDAGRIAGRTPAAFAEAIVGLLAAPPERMTTRRHAERFTWTVNAEALHAHLAGLVAARAGGGRAAAQPSG